MADIINFREAAARRGLHRDTGTRPADLSLFDTLTCMYCEETVPPSEAWADWTVIYRCKCRKVFRITQDGTAHRGLRGPAF